jgi:homoserine kinase type II
MAVYTDLSDEELDALLARYDLGRALAFKGIAEGVENSNFLLETEAGRFILTVYEKRVARADLPFFMGVMETLAQAGLPCPRPIHARDGAVIQSVRGDKPCAIISFLQGVSAKRPTAAQCRAAGAALARMHEALSGSALARPNALGRAAWPRLFEGRQAAAEALEPGLAEAIERDLSDLASLPHDLPTGVIHEDLFPDNVLFLGDSVSGLIDFYFACTDALAYDLGVMLNAWCFEANHREFDLVKGRALIAGYESVRPLTPPERAALPLLARGAALRFFLTRLIDWDATPEGALVRKKDPRDYAARLAFHRRASSIAAYGG